tara:strand:+ start:18631 stop:19674 length:1044 start_codon:yes stop_codon:yes gene_type:complete
MKLLNLTVISAFVVTAIAIPQTSFAKPAACQIALADGGRKTGFIARTNDKGILFTYSENEKGPGEQYTHQQVLAVVFTDEGDIMGPARHAYSRSNYEEAETLFKSVAEEYDNLWGISRAQRGNFASEARYFQVDCLRRLGRYAEIAPALQTNTGKSLENSLAEVYLPKLKLFHMWEKLAGGDWDALAADLKTYEQEATGDKAKLVPVPVFEADSPALLVQLSYMRGKVFAAKDDKENALRDFYRAVTLDYGSDPVLSQKAMDEALAIQSTDPKLKESYPQQTEIHALARVYQEGYAKGDIDIQYREFTREPEMPEAIKKQLEAEKATEKAGEAKAPEAAPVEEKKPE